ncbi:MAG TPA: gliding motility-associated C-terminal domain-containing protein, partial [Saprospiraceae bacterium]|nr:gliding motility-associated C-terminal domain-containing protein [Saprospiraceae bacterium]
VRLENNVFIYKPDPDFKGRDQFSYQVCNTTCSNNCDLALVSINVDNLFPCTMPTIFTPNNDGVNDELRIPCLTSGNRFPNNSISIFNQWGDKIFSAAPYLNDWRGTYNGKDLPSGTYFYILDLGDGSKAESRFLVLER